MKKLTEVQIKLAEQLLLTVKNREMNVEYNELAKRINPPIFYRQVPVHHIKALSEINDLYEVDPIKDLRPVCPNFHLVLHSKIDGDTYDIDELKWKIALNSKT